MGERWRELSEEKREEFARSAKEMADERMKVNPDCWKRKHKKDKEPGQPGIPIMADQQQIKSEHGLNNNTNLLSNNTIENDFDSPTADSKKMK